jgi:hypothetical protein
VPYLAFAYYGKRAFPRSQSLAALTPSPLPVPHPVGLLLPFLSECTSAFSSLLPPGSAFAVDFHSAANAHPLVQGGSSLLAELKLQLVLLLSQAPGQLSIHRGFASSCL